MKLALLDLDRPETRTEEAAPPSEAVQTTCGGRGEAKILRFYKSERLLHWAIAVPFLVCYTTALILVMIYNPDRTRPLRILFATLHRVSGVCLILLPSLVAARCRGDALLHLYNVKQAWTWVFDDFKWLGMLFLSGLSPKFRLPEQGKFNAAEKVNFMVLMGTYPLYIATGLAIWMTHVAFLAWVLHFLMALIATPLILGHMYMAILSRSGRPGLPGMISGFVDRQWARHHYRKWYREHHEPPRSMP